MAPRRFAVENMWAPRHLTAWRQGVSASTPVNVPHFKVQARLPRPVGVVGSRNEACRERRDARPNKVHGLLMQHNKKVAMGSRPEFRQALKHQRTQAVKQGHAEKTV